MSRAVVLLVVVLCCVLSIRCSSSLEREDYIRWVRDYDNGLHVRKTFGEFIFDAQYQPSQYLSLLNDNTRKEDNLQYYVLRVSHLDPTLDILNLNTVTEGERQERLYYFSYLFQNDISLEHDALSTPCVLFHFEQSDLSHERTFVLGFERSSENQQTDELKLVIRSPFISALPIKIKISTENIPALKL